MEQYFEDFLLYMKETRHASDNTIQAYRNDLRKLHRFFNLQNIDSLNKITETNLNSYVLSLEKEGLSPASVSRNIASMKAFLLYCIRQGKLIGDPSERIKPPKVNKKSPQSIDIPYMEKLLDQPDTSTAKGIRDKAMLELLYATGMKVSELLCLKLSDINMTGRYLTCGTRRERTIPIGKSAHNVLMEYLRIRKEKYDKLDCETLFLSSSGKPLSRQGFWKTLKVYSRSAGVGEVSPNVIRHSFAVHLIGNGANIESVQELLGHSDISTTQLYLPQDNRSSREVYLRTHPRA